MPVKLGLLAMLEAKPGMEAQPAVFLVAATAVADGLTA